MESERWTKVEFCSRSTSRALFAMTAWEGVWKGIRRDLSGPSSSEYVVENRRRRRGEGRTRCA